MGWRERVKHLFSRFSIVGWSAIAMSILGQLGNVDTAYSLPHVVSAILRWLETPLGYWSMLALGLLILIRLVLWPLPQVKPSLAAMQKEITRLTKEIEAIQPKVTQLWQERPVMPYVRINYLSARFLSHRQVQVHFELDTNIVVCIDSVKLKVSEQILEAQNWGGLDSTKSNSSVAVFDLPDWIVPRDYLVQLVASTYVGIHETDPFHLEVPRQ